MVAGTIGAGVLFLYTAAQAASTAASVIQKKCCRNLDLTEIDFAYPDSDSDSDSEFEFDVSSHKSAI